MLKSIRTVRKPTSRTRGPTSKVASRQLTICLPIVSRLKPVRPALTRGSSRSVARAPVPRTSKRTFFHSRLALQPNGESSEANQSKHQQQKKQQDDDVDDEAEEVPNPLLTQLQDQAKVIKDMEKTIEELKAGWKIALAEQDNIRKRSQKEIEKAREFGVEKLCKHLFNVNDTVNIILNNKPNFELPYNKDNSHAKSAFEGLEQVKNQFVGALRDAYEIEEVYPELGENFDPLQHNALFEVDAPVGKNIQPGQVGLVVKSAWKRKGTLLRPASVGVVKAAPEPKNSKKSTAKKEADDE